MDPQRRYSDDEVARILDEATEAQASAGPALTSGTGMSLAELEDIGREVGISTEAIRRAAARIDSGGVPAVPERRVMGTTIGVGRTVELPRKLTDDEWARLVIDLRHTFDARGKLHDEGPFRQWTNGNLQALLEPTDTGQRLRLKTLKSDALPTMGISGGLLSMALVLVLISLLTGGIEPDQVQAILMFTLMGGGWGVVNHFRLSRWAETRQLQMDEIAERLLASMADTAADMIEGESES